MEFRLLVADDAESAVALRRMALSTDGYAFAERADSDPASDLDFVRPRLAKSGVESGAVVVGAFDPDLIGIVGLNRFRTDSARLWGFYVHPRRRGKRVGHTLLDHALEYARQKTSVARVELWVSEASVAAIRLYESAGFVTVETTEGKRHMTLVIRVAAGRVDGRSATATGPARLAGIDM